MLEQQIKTNLQKIIDLATQTTIMLQNNANKDQQKLPPRKKDEGSGEDQLQSPPKCSVCGVALSNPDHTLCWKHWIERNKTIEEA